jgi:hypothetical protein
MAVVIIIIMAIKMREAQNGTFCMLTQNIL